MINTYPIRCATCGGVYMVRHKLDDQKRACNECEKLGLTVDDGGARFIAEDDPLVVYDEHGNAHYCGEPYWNRYMAIREKNK